jgi:pimeloyl-ACP methyl ester carboxylesterase
MIKVGLPAMLYRFLGSERLLERVLRAMVTRSDPDPIVRETIAVSLRYVRLEREFPSATVDELNGFTALVALFAAEGDPFFPSESVVSRVHSRLPNVSRTEILDGEKHVLSPEAQETVTASISAFFNQ